LTICTELNCICGDPQRLPTILIYLEKTRPYLLSPRSRDLLEKLTALQLVKKLPAFLWIPKVLYRTHNCPPPAPILSQFHQVPTTPSNFLKIHLNIVHSTTSGSPQWSLSLRLSHQNPVHTSLLPQTRHMPRPSHSSRFYHPHNIE
jgi:hypothetical protein